ncbi:MAG: DMT family transporter [Cellulomonas sp.]|nr:DMT family transporter [Cellulomonas sp.]
MDRPAAPPRASRTGLYQVCAAGVLWGTGGVVVTLLHDRAALGAMTVSAWRMAVAAVALVAFAAVTGRLRPAVALMRTHPLLTIVIGTGTAAYQGLYFVSVLLVGVGVATVVSLGLAPILAATWEHVARRTRPSWTEAAILGAALAGLLLISATAGHGSPTPGGNPTVGLALAVAAGATYAATTVLGHTLAQRADPIALTTCTTTVGAVVLAPFAVVAAATGQPLVPGDAWSLVLLVYLGVGTMALSYGLLYAGLRTTSGAAATIATLMEPLSAALLAALVLGERLTWPTMLGGVLILAAVVALRPDEEHPAPA